MVIVPLNDKTLLTLVELVNFIILSLHASLSVENDRILSIVEIQKRVLVLHVFSVISTLRPFSIRVKFNFAKLVHIKCLSCSQLLVMDHLKLIWRVFMKNLIEIC